MSPTLKADTVTVPKEQACGDVGTSLIQVFIEHGDQFPSPTETPRICNINSKKFDISHVV